MAGPNKTGLFGRAREAEQRGNREGRDRWDRYAGHRAHTTEAILALAPNSPGRLCLLGAGNANDLDLERIAGRFREVHLVDIDEAAISRALGRQSPATRAKLVGHAPVDLSGLYDKLDLPAANRPSGEALVAAGTASVLGQLPGGFDVVVSGSMLSQMSWALGQLAARGGGATLIADELPALEQALVAIHLRSLLGLLGPGGVALLVADLVSSESYPLDELDPDADLAALAQRLASERIAFAVCNPELVKQILRRDPVLRSAAAAPEIGSPWLWSGARDLTFLVYPLTLRARTPSIG